MKRNNFLNFYSLIVFVLLFSQRALSGNEIDLVQKATLIDRNNQKIELNVKIIENEFQHANLSNEILNSEHLIITSDLSNEVVRKSEIISTVEKSKAKKIGFFEIYGSNRAQKVKTLVYISLQSSVSTFSYLFLTGQKIAPALTASIVSTALNFYFGANPNRWDQILNWGQSRYENGLKKTKMNQEQSEKFLNIAGPLATTFFWRIGTGFMMSGIAAWSDFHNQFATEAFISNVIMTSLMGVFISGTWEAVFSKWNKMNLQKIEGSPLTSEDIIANRRNRALMAAVLFPLAYSGLQAANYGLGLMAATGAVLYILENSRFQKETRNFIKKSNLDFSQVFKTKRMNQCHQLF